MILVHENLEFSIFQTASQDEDGEDRITVCLYVEPNISHKDYGSKLLNVLSRVNEICEKEYQSTHAFLDFKRPRGQT